MPPDELEEFYMDEDAFNDAIAPRSTLPTNAARAAAWGLVALVAVLGFVAWKRLRK